MSAEEPAPPPPESVQAPHEAFAETQPAPALPPAAPLPRLTLPFGLHPNFWWAVLWCIALQLFTQVPGIVVSVLILLFAALLFPSSLPMDQLKDGPSLLANPVGQVSIGAALFVSQGLIFLLAFVLLRIFAGRDWPRQVALRLPRPTHLLLVLLVTPAVIVLANGVTLAMTTPRAYVPTFADDLTGALAFLAVLAAGILLLGLAALVVHLCGLRLRLPLLGQVLLALALAGAARFPAVWAYSAVRDALLTTPLAGMKMQGMQELGDLFARWPLAVGVFVIGVMPGLSEELFCRGFLGRGLVGVYGLFWGVLATSFFFGVIHLDPRQGAMAMLFGVILHTIYLTSRSLLLPMLLHFLNNSVAVGLTHVPNPERFDNPDPEVAWPLLLCSAVLLAAVVWALVASRARLVAAGPGEPWRLPYPGVALPPPGANTLVHSPPAPALVMWLVAAAFVLFVAALAQFIYLIS